MPGREPTPIVGNLVLDAEHLEDQFEAFEIEKNLEKTPKSRGSKEFYQSLEVKLFLQTTSPKKSHNRNTHTLDAHQTMNRTVLSEATANQNGPRPIRNINELMYPSRRRNQRPADKLSKTNLEFNQISQSQSVNQSPDTSPNKTKNLSIIQPSKHKGKVFNIFRLGKNSLDLGASLPNNPTSSGPFKIKRTIQNEFSSPNSSFRSPMKIRRNTKETISVMTEQRLSRFNTANQISLKRDPNSDVQNISTQIKNDHIPTISNSSPLKPPTTKTTDSLRKSASSIIVSPIKKNSPSKGLSPPHNFTQGQNSSTHSHKPETQTQGPDQSSRGPKINYHNNNLQRSCFFGNKAQRARL